jgi:hypothetical protein
MSFSGKLYLPLFRASAVMIRLLRFPENKEKCVRKELSKMNLTTPKAILTGFSLIALAILFQPPIKQLLTPSAQAQPLVSDHEILKADHKAIKTVLTDLAFKIEHLPTCNK